MNHVIEFQRLDITTMPCAIKASTFLHQQLAESNKGEEKKLKFLKKLTSLIVLIIDEFLVF